MEHKRRIFMAVLCAFGMCLSNSIIQQTPEVVNLRASVLFCAMASRLLTRSIQSRLSR